MMNDNNNETNNETSNDGAASDAGTYQQSATINGSSQFANSSFFTGGFQPTTTHTPYNPLHPMPSLYSTTIMVIPVISTVALVSVALPDQQTANPPYRQREWQEVMKATKKCLL
ncbi:hypothetical protein L484_017388 [Morus notabilis]|uniref:Uncharacterized protein n=1 Tax=Morus notabilis TaxID=981085 RepID=W9RTF4_9ROSA|nr:hypothetical protein L484_017388 [Morus notabilis]